VVHADMTQIIISNSDRTIDVPRAVPRNNEIMATESRRRLHHWKTESKIARGMVTRLGDLLRFISL
jgi:hypothetical protein